MTALDQAGRPSASISPALFAVTTFASAGLVFLVQPMVAKLVLPLLGGSPSVWNTSIAFFQAALLAGYGYAHLLQKVSSIRIQAVIHVAALLAAALVLPLRVSGVLGEPSSDHPSLWLLGVLTLSIGAPFAVLSATAPLVQAWHARTVHAETGAEPYVLYAASNLGSLLALLAYPVMIEPLSTVRGQTLGWSGGYVAFVLLMASLALVVSRTRAGSAPAPTLAEAGPRPTWRERLVWVALAAIPSSLMLGVTTHITTDVASAPFLWVIPLALYLATFIIAFSDKPIISSRTTLFLQAAAVAACAAMLPFKNANFPLQLFVHLAAFFLTALMCHQALVARRPNPAHLTEFYLFMSFGGVVGGSFNAFLAPVIFVNVWEYPLVLVLACLARPGSGLVRPWRWAVFVGGMLAAAAAAYVIVRWGQDGNAGRAIHLLLAATAVSAFVLQGRMIMFFGLIAILSISAEVVGDRVDIRQSWRSFFGVVQQSELPVRGMKGQVRMLSHGTTLHGAQAQHPDYDCRPLVYYAPETPIGQVFTRGYDGPKSLRIGAVGLGTGAVAAYTRPGDHLTFFEIDPMVIRIATDPKHFTFTTECAGGKIDYVVGDARLTLNKQPNDTFDILLIDAFSSDAVPAHLLTVEAMQGYLAKLKPDGVVILHLSNRNLELRSPATAVAEAAGGFALIQRHDADPRSPPLWESSEDALIVARSPAALEPYRMDKRWTQADAGTARPWTDDYVNLPGAFYTQMKIYWPWLP